MRSHVPLVLAALLGCFAGFAALAPPASAAEFNCNASVDYKQLSGTGFTFLNELQRDVRLYMNRNAWTQHRFARDEAIDCSIQIVIEEAITLTSFRARLILTSLRPIYATTQNTRVLQIQDGNWEFDYAQGQPLTFDVETFNPLTSMLDFYAYVMLGYDFDTFSELGGTPYLEKARRIAELAQSRNATGWSQIADDRGRSALITQLLDPRMQPLRRAYFDYHFGGLDRFVTDTQLARETTLDVLRDLQSLYDNVSRQYVIDIFFGTKYEELAAIFENSPSASEAYAVLTQVDPSHLTAYDRLVQ